MAHDHQLIRKFVMLSRNVFFIFLLNYIITYILAFNFVGGWGWYFISGEYTEALGNFARERSNRLGYYAWSLYAPTLLLAAFSLASYMIMFLTCCTLLNIIHKNLKKFYVFISLFLWAAITYFFIFSSYLFMILFFLSFLVVVVHIISRFKLFIYIDCTSRWLLLIAFWAPAIVLTFFTGAQSIDAYHYIVYYIIPVVVAALFWCWVCYLDKKYINKN